MNRLNRITLSLSTKDQKGSEILVENNVINAAELVKAARKETGSEENFKVYDPGFSHTASAKSAITFIDGEKGILMYRGYKIEDLAENSTFLEVAFLLIYGELPTNEELEYFTNRVMRHTFVHSDLARMMQGFRFNSHPMGMLISTFASMSTLHPEANPALSGQNIYRNKLMRNKQIHRLIGTTPTIAAFSYRHRCGRPFVNPSHKKLSYTENFMYMIDRVSNRDYKPNATLAKVLDTMFILHADHELNCSTAAMRHLTSSGVDVYSSLAGSTAALYGPKHGGANQAVIQMLKRIGTVDAIPKFLTGVKAKTERLMGFGHRVYKNYDPRARIIKSLAKKVFDLVGEEPLVEVAVELERLALSDEYFVKRKLYPNVDFYSGIIYKALGFPEDFFPVLFAVPRTVGWLAHWNEFLDDPENKITRPRQVYIGKLERKYVKIEDRKISISSKTVEKTVEKKKNLENMEEIKSYVSSESKRRFCSDYLP